VQAELLERRLPAGHALEDADVADPVEHLAQAVGAERLDRVADLGGRAAGRACRVREAEHRDREPDVGVDRRRGRVDVERTLARDERDEAPARLGRGGQPLEAVERPDEPRDRSAVGRGRRRRPGRQARRVGPRGRGRLVVGDARPQQGRHHAGVEAGPGPGLERGERRRTLVGRPVRAVGEQRAERLAHGDDPRAEGDRVADQAVRVPAAVPALVVVAHEQRRTLQMGHQRQDLAPRTA
jgi:hypothetical protein